MGFLRSLANGIRGVGKVIGKTVEVGKRIGSFIARHHQTLAPLAHGLAMATGHEGLQKVTGLALAASKTAQLKANVDASSARMAAARMAAGKGGSGLYNATTGTYGS